MTNIAMENRIFFYEEAHYYMAFLNSYFDITRGYISINIPVLSHHIPSLSHYNPYKTHIKNHGKPSFAHYKTMVNYSKPIIIPQGRLKPPRESSICRGPPSTGRADRAGGRDCDSGEGRGRVCRDQWKDGI